MPDDLEERRSVAEEATRAAGAIHLKYLSSTIDYEAKTDPRDVLTKADLEGQDAAKAVLQAAFPDDTLIGEEDGIPVEQLLELVRDWLLADRPSGRHAELRALLPSVHGGRRLGAGRCLAGRRDIRRRAGRHVERGPRPRRVLATASRCARRPASR